MAQPEKVTRDVLLAVFPWWLYAIVVVGSLLLATGAALALFHPSMLVSPQDEINHAASVYAGYFFSRNLALAAMLLLMMVLRAKGPLHTLMVLTAFVQFLDACIDAFEGRWAIVPGVTVYGLVFLLGAARLSGYAFWKIEAWKNQRTLP